MEQIESVVETWESPLFKKSRSKKTAMNRLQLTLIITVSGFIMLPDTVEEFDETEETRQGY